MPRLGIPLPPVEELKELLDYNPETGIITWKVQGFNAMKIGDVAGRDCSGYIRIRINQRDYMAHRLCWVLYHGRTLEPDETIDHINRNKKDNRIENLRIATRSEQGYNRKLSSKNTSGFRGVFYCNDKKRWRAVIKQNGKRIFSKLCKTKEEAIAARLQAEREHAIFIYDGPSHA